MRNGTEAALNPVEGFDEHKVIVMVAEPEPLPILPAGQIQVWAGDPRQLGSQPELAQLLSRDEAQRAARLRDTAQRELYIAARAQLRLLLARYILADEGYDGQQQRGALARRAGALRFSYGPFGKPALAEARGLQFSLAHSQSMVVYAFGRGHAVGIDLEPIHEGLNDLPLEILTAGEQAHLEGLHLSERDRWFLQQWTRKEALLKGIGTGLQRDPATCEVGVGPPWPGGLLGVCSSDGRVEPWAVADLALTPGYAAAVAARGYTWTISFHGMGNF